MKTTSFQSKVYNEYKRARTYFPPFNSGHEGYAVLLEEVQELWNEIKKSKDSRRINSRMITECIQISAMSMAFVMDLQDDKHSFEVEQE